MHGHFLSEIRRLNRHYQSGAAAEIILPDPDTSVSDYEQKTVDEIVEILGGNGGYVGCVDVGGVQRWPICFFSGIGLDWLTQTDWLELPTNTYTTAAGLSITYKKRTNVQILSNTGRADDYLSNNSQLALMTSYYKSDGSYAGNQYLYLDGPAGTKFTEMGTYPAYFPVLDIYYFYSTSSSGLTMTTTDIKNFETSIWTPKNFGPGDFYSGDYVVGQRKYYGLARGYGFTIGNSYFDTSAYTVSALNMAGYCLDRRTSGAYLTQQFLPIAGQYYGRTSISVDNTTYYLRVLMICKQLVARDIGINDANKEA